jgi:hypothetical protein
MLRVCDFFEFARKPALKSRGLRTLRGPKIKKVIASEEWIPDRDSIPWKRFPSLALQALPWGLSV